MVFHTLCYPFNTSSAQVHRQNCSGMYKILTSSFPNNFLHHCLHFQKLFVAKRKNDEKTSSSRGFIGSRHEWKHDNLRGPLVTTLLLLLSAAWGLFWALLHLKSRIIRYVSFYYLQKSDCLPHHSIFQSSRLFFSSPSLLAGIIFWTSTFAVACVVKMSILLWRWIPFRFEHDVEKVQQIFSLQTTK